MVSRITTILGHLEMGTSQERSLSVRCPILTETSISIDHISIMEISLPRIFGPVETRFSRIFDPGDRVIRIVDPGDPIARDRNLSFGTERMKVSL